MKMVILVYMTIKVKNSIKKNYSRFFIRFTYNERKTKCQKLEKGIITGDTISVIPFPSAINLIVKSA